MHSFHIVVVSRHILLAAMSLLTCIGSAPASLQMAGSRVVYEANTHKDASYALLSIIEGAKSSFILDVYIVFIHVYNKYALLCASIYSYHTVIRVSTPMHLTLQHHHIEDLRVPVEKGKAPDTVSELRRCKVIGGGCLQIPENV